MRYRYLKLSPGGNGRPFFLCEADMQFGAINFPIRPLIDEIRSIAALGFDYIELAMDSPEASPQNFGRILGTPY